MCGLVYFQGIQNSKLIDSALSSIHHRGPDQRGELQIIDGPFLGLQRLAIMDPSENGTQPFENDHFAFVCNGEFYNFKDIKAEYDHYPYTSNSDSEVLFPLLEKYTIHDLLQKLDGEFAFAVYDKSKKTTFAARDHLGIRPLFYGYERKSQKICFASEAKALMKVVEKVFPFPPGHYFKDNEFHRYSTDYSKIRPKEQGEEEVKLKIKDLFTKTVIKRLHADCPLGFLLSGGLDSSLVCALSQRYFKKPIKTFAIGLDQKPIDLKYAKEVADYIQSDHQEVIFTIKEAIEHLEPLIAQMETWDITTIRAGLGMSLICKFIQEKTDLKVLLTGEVSDELFGYKYTDFAPNAQEFQNEAIKRVDELYMYDVLRADRCLAFHSLEARVPFSDRDFVDYVMSISPSMKMNKKGIGKALLREAFDGENLLPQSILYREKAAFSDAVGHSLVDGLKDHAEKLYSDEKFKKLKGSFTHHPPQTKEALMYREIFRSIYPNHDHLIKSYWLPNSSWPGCSVKDPSARVLENYGKSGD